jgi:hypothetical protein
MRFKPGGTHMQTPKELLQAVADAIRAYNETNCPLIFRTPTGTALGQLLNQIEALYPHKLPFTIDNNEYTILHHGKILVHCYGQETRKTLVDFLNKRLPKG